jgi:DNA-directed RNA polymerase specialized sigma24 family protein
VVAGEAAAWQELWTTADPVLERSIRNLRNLGPLPRSEDHRRNIALTVIERLRADDFRRLKTFLAQAEQRPDSDFWRWLSRVTTNVALDYLRADAEYTGGRRRPSSEEDEAFWVQLVSVDLHDPSFRPPLTNLLAAQRLLEVAAAALDDEQLLALRYWLCGSTFEEIAAVMELPAAKYAERLVRAALERLRRRFGG